MLRVHNAWVTPPLAGFDGPYHAAYIGIIFLEGRWPLSQESWSTFHPPLYYALSALVWKLLPDGLGPHAVLFWLRMLNVAAGLAIGFAVQRSARLLFPQRPRVEIYAVGLALFLPMLIGPSSELGNEMLAAAFCALAVPLWLRCLQEPDSRRRALALGAVLGLAVLSKLNATRAGRRRRPGPDRARRADARRSPRGARDPGAGRRRHPAGFRASTSRATWPTTANPS